MWLKVLTILFTILSAIHIGTALRCYICAGTESSDCARRYESLMATQSCDNLNNNTFKFPGLPDFVGLTDPANFSCITVYETEYKPKLFMRGCVAYPSNEEDVCSLLENSGYFEDCRSCTTDLCHPKLESDSDENLLY